jgi:hypothetical protein
MKAALSTLTLAIACSAVGAGRLHGRKGRDNVKAAGDRESGEIGHYPQAEPR